MRASNTPHERVRLGVHQRRRRSPFHLKRDRLTARRDAHGSFIYRCERTTKPRLVLDESECRLIRSQRARIKRNRPAAAYVRDVSNELCITSGVQHSLGFAPHGAAVRCCLVISEVRVDHMHR
jgi:hypothetical protein